MPLCFYLTKLGASNPSSIPEILSVNLQMQGAWPITSLSLQAGSAPGLTCPVGGRRAAGILPVGAAFSAPPAPPLHVHSHGLPSGRLSPTASRQPLYTNRLRLCAGSRGLSSSHREGDLREDLQFGLGRDNPCPEANFSVNQRRPLHSSWAAPSPHSPSYKGPVGIAGTSWLSPGESLRSLS